MRMMAQKRVLMHWMQQKKNLSSFERTVFEKLKRNGKYGYLKKLNIGVFIV